MARTRSSTRNMNREFFLVLADEDRKIFNVVGPMVDDDAWNAKIVELQDSGRNVRCFSTGVHRSVEQIAALYSNQSGFAYSDQLITEPLQRTIAGYEGFLPEYASRADRNRVVQLLCDRCGTTRWAEMNIHYPGQQALRDAKNFNLSATCLKCGAVAHDSYNWHR
jgi:hypothetical protein